MQEGKNELQEKFCGELENIFILSKDPCFPDYLMNTTSPTMVESRMEKVTQKIQKAFEQSKEKKEY